MTTREPGESAPAALPRSRRDLEGPSPSAIEGSALNLAGVLQTQVVSGRTRYDRRMTVLGLLHRDPQLLVETVLALAEEPTPGRSDGW